MASLKLDWQASKLAVRLETGAGFQSGHIKYTTGTKLAKLTKLDGPVIVLEAHRNRHFVNQTSQHSPYTSMTVTAMLAMGIGEAA